VTAGLVDDGKIQYIISLFAPVRKQEVRPRLRNLSRRVYDLINNLQQ